MLTYKRIGVGSQTKPTPSKFLFIMFVGLLGFAVSTIVFLESSGGDRVQLETQHYVISWNAEDDQVFGEDNDIEQRGGERNAMRIAHSHCTASCVVTVASAGRLGNQLGEYATALGVARSIGCEAHVSLELSAALKRHFQNISLPIIEFQPPCKYQPVVTVKDWTADFMDSKLFSFQPWRGKINLPTCAFMPQYFHTFRDEIKQHFLFRKVYTDNADLIIRKTRQLFLNKTDIALVGVHVRRTDYQHHFQRLYKADIIGASFFSNAMNYFNSRYETPVFLVASDNVTWCREHLPKQNVLFAEDLGQSDPVSDLALMAACDHSIIDHGTFGFFGIFLRNEAGETVVADSPFPGQPYEKYFHWKLMTA